jgi:allophanate hydrolase subunit 1
LKPAARNVRGRGPARADRATRRARPSSRDVDIVVSHPRKGQLQVVSRYFFADPKAEACQLFIERIFEVEEVRAVEILARRACANVEYVKGAREAIAKISWHLRNGDNGRRAPYMNSPRDLPLAFAGGVGGWRVERHGPVLSTWEITHELPGRIRFRNRLIHRKEDVCRAIDRSLTRVRGIERYRTNPNTATVLIVYDPRKVLRQQLVQSLDQALVDAERRDPEAAPSRRLPVCTASLGLATAGLFFAPSLVPFMLLEIAVLGGALCLLGLQAFRKSPEPSPETEAHARPRPGVAQEASIEIPSSRRLFAIGGLALGVSAIGDAFYPPLRTRRAGCTRAATTRSSGSAGSRSTGWPPASMP